MLESEPPDVKLLLAVAGEGVEVKLVGNVSAWTNGDGAADDDVQGNPGAAVHGLQAVLQRRRTGSIGDADRVRGLCEQCGLHAVE